MDIWKYVLALNNKNALIIVDCLYLHGICDILKYLNLLSNVVTVFDRTKNIANIASAVRMSQCFSDLMHCIFGVFKLALSHRWRYCADYIG